MSLCAARVWRAQLQAQNALLTDRRLELESEIQARRVTVDGLTQRLITLRKIARSTAQQADSLTAQAANLKSLADEGICRATAIRRSGGKVRHCVIRRMTPGYR